MASSAFAASMVDWVELKAEVMTKYPNLLAEHS